MTNKDKHEDHEGREEKKQKVKKRIQNPELFVSIRVNSWQKRIIQSVKSVDRFLIEN